MGIKRHMRAPRLRRDHAPPSTLPLSTASAVRALRSDGVVGQAALPEEPQFQRALNGDLLVDVLAPLVRAAPAATLSPGRSSTHAFTATGT